MPKFERKYDRAKKCALILDVLRQPDSVPFIALAAEQCGVNRSTVRYWMRLGEDHADKNPDLALFTEEVKSLRAAFMLKAASMIATALDKGQDIRAKHLEWLLHKLDGESFDPPKKVANVEKERPLEGDEPEVPTPPSNDEVGRIADELAKVN